MLFNTFNFVFLFLPTCIIFLGIVKRIKNNNLYILLLILLSLYFYSYFLTSYTLILINSILFNFFFGKLLIRSKQKNIRKLIFLTIIVINLIILIYFKYFNFLKENINFVFNENILDSKSIILPLAISFFTFQQITFITNIYNKEIKKFNFIKYALFISFFPQLIAGPIIKFKEFYPNISKSIKLSLTQSYLIIGLFIFSIGMFKKIIISNYLASIADPIFLSLENDQLINSLEAWIGLLAFSLQIYFDFSGYTDMAIGLAYCLGFRLPINFNSPYKSKSIKDFWGNWHITLSRFLKYHIYFPLGGNRKGNFFQYRNIFFTMLIGGIWHGASWNFVLWGAYHGNLILLEKVLNKVINFNKSFLFNKYVVFMLVTIGWVPFRCQSISSTLLMFKSLFSFNFYNLRLDSINFILNVLYIVLIFIVVMYLPNSTDIQKKLEKNILFKKNFLLIYLMIAFSIIFFLLAEPNQNINREFIYFQF